MEQKFSGMEGVVEVKNPLIPQETPPQEPDFQAIHDAVAVEASERPVYPGDWGSRRPCGGRGL